MMRTAYIRSTMRISAVILTATLLTFSQAALAQGASLAGAWKVDSAKSNFSAGSARLSIARDESGMDKGSDPFLVVSDDGNVYLATGAEMREAASFAIRTAGYSHMDTDKMVLIGTNAQRDDFCGFRCQSGVMERRVTLRFISVDGAEHLMADMLAYKAPKQ